MESTVPVVRFVKCPKCLKILTEFAEIPVYKCGGCGAILRAKARSSSGQNLSTVSSNPASKNLSDSDPLSNESESQREKKLISTKINNLKVSDSSGDNNFKGESLGHDQNEIKILNEKSHDPKEEPSGLEGTSSGERLEEGNKELEISSNVSPEAYDSLKSSDKLDESSETSSGERLEEGNKDLEISSNVNPEAYDSLKASDKLDESSETMRHCTTSEEDMLNMEFGNGTNFRMTNRSSSHVYDGSVSSTDDDRKYYIPDKYRLSRRTFRNKNVSDSFDNAKAGEDHMRKSSNERLPSARAMEQDSFFTPKVFRRNWIQSENDESSSSPTKDAKIKINHRFSEKDGRVMILNKVDELRNELSGLLNETANDKGSSIFGVKKSQFQGKVPSKEHRSSLIPFSRQPSIYPGDKCCHNEHCRPCPHNVCCHLNEAASLPLHKQISNTKEEAQNLQYKASRLQTRLCRPVSGGAPFVICYKCFKLLQLPMDFLVSPKRVNKLRCGSCSQVLMYCFRPPRSRSIPQTPADVQHPPSEENNEFNVAPLYKKNTYRDQISTSEESGLSFTKSKSSEVEPALHKSRSFDDIVEEEQDKGREVSGSRLHSLMGYFSASEILFHNGYSHDGSPSTDSDTSNFYRSSGRKRWERN